MWKKVGETYKKYFLRPGEKATPGEPNTGKLNLESHIFITEGMPTRSKFNVFENKITTYLLPLRYLSLLNMQYTLHHFSTFTYIISSFLSFFLFPFLSFPSSPFLFPPPFFPSSLNTFFFPFFSPPSHGRRDHHHPNPPSRLGGRHLSVTHCATRGAQRERSAPRSLANRPSPGQRGL